MVWTSIPSSSLGTESELLDDNEDEKLRADQALAWANKYCQQNSMIEDMTVDRTIRKLAMQNTSNPCNRNFRSRILMGYLKRRYKLRGKLCRMLSN